MMFDGPEHASYIALCRELRVPFDSHDEPSLKGSWFEARPGDIFLAGESDPDAGSAYPTEKCVLLPRLDQWLAMLEEVSGHVFMLERDGDVYEATLGEGSWVGGNGPTREEAVARLWMALR